MSLPKIELRKITHNAKLSEETNAFTAQIWVDGAYFCDVMNQGHGGPDIHSVPKGGVGFQERLRALEETVKRDFPKIDVSYLHRKPAGTEMMDASLETVVGGLLEDYLTIRDMKRRLAKNVVYQVPGKKGLYQMALRGRPADEVIRAVKTHQKVERTLNEMPLEEALVLWRTAA
jgi:hypothetical protein